MRRHRTSLGKAARGFQAAFYRWVAAELGEGGAPRWNFHKYLVGPDGELAGTWPSSREILFTVVPREDRYKEKSFIDTVVYRFGDHLGAWSVAALIGFGPAEVAMVAAGRAAPCLITALWLGRRQEVREAAPVRSAAE